MRGHRRAGNQGSAGGEARFPLGELDKHGPSCGAGSHAAATRWRVRQQPIGLWLAKQLTWGPEVGTKTAIVRPAAIERKQQARVEARWIVRVERAR